MNKKTAITAAKLAATAKEKELVRRKLAITAEEIVKSYIHSGVSKYYVKSDHRLDEIIDDIKLSLAHSEAEVKALPLQ